MPTEKLSVQWIWRMAAHRADMLVDDGTGNTTLSDFIDPTAIVVDLNLEVSTLWDALVSAHEDYAIRHKMIDTRADQETYILPEDFYKFRKVFPVVSGNRGYALRKFQLKDLGDADTLTPIRTTRIEDTKYRIIGNRLMLHPVPTSSDALELWYVPQCKQITQAEEKLDFRFPNGWEEYVIEGLAAKMLEKEESDSSAQRAAQGRALGRILSMVEDRDAGEPFQMIDVEEQLW